MTIISAAGATPAAARAAAPSEVHDLGFSSSARLAVGAGATATLAGGGALVAALRAGGDFGPTRGHAALFGLGVGAAIGLAGSFVAVASTWEAGRSVVGDVDGTYSYQVKVGERDVLTMCTRNVWDGDEYVQETYPCWKTENIYETRYASTTEDLKVMSQVARGSLEEVAAAVGDRKGSYVVIRHDGAYQAHSIGDGRIQWPGGWSLDTPGAVAVVRGDNQGGATLVAEGPDITAEERTALK